MRINWPFMATVAGVLTFWLVLLLLSGCAKPNYEVIHEIQRSMVESNERIAAAVAGGQHKQVEISFAQEAYIPAGTTITTWYDWTHAIQYADTRVNPGVQTFQAEAQRDAAIVLGIVPPLVAAGVTAYSGYNSRKMTEAIVQNVGGGVDISAAEGAEVTWTGDVGARSWGLQYGDMSGASYEALMDQSQNPVATTTDNSNQNNPVVNPDPVIVPQPPYNDPVIVQPPPYNDPIIVPSPDPIIVDPVIVNPVIVPGTGD